MLITASEVADILGLTLQSVYDATSRGRLTRHTPSHVRTAYDRDEIEQLSLARISHAGHGISHYWASTEEAAAEMGVTRSAVRQMMLADRLPYVTAPSWRRYVRRHQLYVIADARDTRLTEEAVRPKG